MKSKTNTECVIYNVRRKRFLNRNYKFGAKTLRGAKVFLYLYVTPSFRDFIGYNRYCVLVPVKTTREIDLSEEFLTKELLKNKSL